MRAWQDSADFDAEGLEQKINWSYDGLQLNDLMELKRLFEKEQHKDLLVLYYAGHGCREGGALFMEDRNVTFEDVLSAWEGRPGARKPLAEVSLRKHSGERCFAGVGEATPRRLSALRTS